MANRLTSITTGTGDDGTTGIVGGNRLGKDDPRIEAIGCVDELNCAVGLAVAELDDGSDAANLLQGRLIAIQHDLFDLGGELAMPPEVILTEAHHQRLTLWQDGMNDKLPPLANFILPGGSKALAGLHLARSSARRAERRLVSLNRSGAGGTGLNVASLIYLNRLSDFLFVAARWLCAERGDSERLWQQNIHRE